MATVRVENLRQFVRTCDESSAELSAFMRDGLFAIAESVAVDIRSRYSPYSAKGAAGVKAKVAKSGTALDAQTVRKGRGLRQRPNFGGLMFRQAFLPALAANEEKAQIATRSLIDKIDNDYWKD